jgi:hypothetical protein
LEGSVVALITNSHKCARMYIGIADYTFSITLLTKASNSNSWLLPAHNQIRMMLGHDLFKILVFLRAPAGIDLRLCSFSFSRERGKPGETSALYDFFFFLLLFLILASFSSYSWNSSMFAVVSIICLIYCQTETSSSNLQLSARFFLLNLWFSSFLSLAL